MRYGLTTDRPKRAFTLLELMIVLAILVSVMAVAWPRISKRMQQLGPREAALQVTEAMAEARERSISSGQAWAFRIERGSAFYEIGPVSEFREQVLSTALPQSGRFPATQSEQGTSEPLPATGNQTLASPSNLVSVETIQRSELPPGIVFDDGFAHQVSDINSIQQSTTVTAPQTPLQTPAIAPLTDNWKFAVVFQPDGRATESEILLKEQTSENKIRLRIRGFTGGVTIDKLERKAQQALTADPLSESDLPASAEQDAAGEPLRDPMLQPSPTIPPAGLTPTQRVPR